LISENQPTVKEVSLTALSAYKPRPLRRNQL